MRHRFSRSALFGLPAAALVVAGGVSAVQAVAIVAPGSGLGWRKVAVVSVPSLSSALLTVTAATPARAWAFGLTGRTSPTPSEFPLVDRWNGHAWSRVTLPSAVVSALGASPLLVASSSSGPGNVWAFTVFGTWLHGNGSTWKAGSLPKIIVVVESSLARAPNSAWVFGGVPTRTGLAPYAAFWTRSGWTQTLVPGTGGIASASAVTSGDIWAVIGEGATGVFDRGSGPAELVHWSRGHWHVVKGLPAVLRGATLGAILADSDKNIWVGGGVKNGGGGTTEVVGHWNGSKWSVVKLKAPVAVHEFRVTSLAADGSGGVWALGTCLDQGCSGNGLSRLWHEVHGRWSGPLKPKLASKPNALLALAPVGRSVWGAGDVTATSTATNGLIAVWGRLPR